MGNFVFNVINSLLVLAFICKFLLFFFFMKTSHLVFKASMYFSFFLSNLLSVSAGYGLQYTVEWHSGFLAFLFISRRNFSIFTIKYDVNSQFFFKNAPFQVEEVLFYFQFLKSTYDKLMLNFVRCFFFHHLRCSCGCLLLY